MSFQRSQLMAVSARLGSHLGLAWFILRMRLFSIHPYLLTLLSLPGMAALRLTEAEP